MGNLPKKVFVSYKYSDVVEGKEGQFNFRDDLIKRLKGQGSIHKGENDESFDMSDYSDDEIYQKIAPYIKKSSITVVLLSPNAKYSNWIPWEISLSLRERTYKSEPKMTRNGIIGVYLPLNSMNIPDKNGTYDYFKRKKDCGTIVHYTDKLPKMINDNSFNLKNGAGKCSKGCCTNVYSSKEGSYIELVEWKNFISNIDAYIERAWKRRNNFDAYDVRINLIEGQ